MVSVQYANDAFELFDIAVHKTQACIKLAKYFYLQTLAFGIKTPA
jgi:hypothetical protein